ncbi:MAG: chromosomal replication initiator protein DnaA [Hyphomicrobiales bacterium]
MGGLMAGGAEKREINGAGDGTASLTMQQLREAWAKVAQRLRAELGDDLYTSWFGRMEPEAFAGGVLTVSVPTRFLRSWIENHYAGKLSKIASGEFAGLRQVLVKVRAQGAGQAPAVVSRAAVPARVERTGETGPLQQAGHFLPQSAGEALARLPVTDENLTFDTFMVGPSNQFAHAAAMRVASGSSSAGQGFNPLYIHAGAGLGKTHLLSAIGQRLKATQPHRKVLMLTAERFMYSFISAVRQRDTLAFKDQFQSVDVLLIDDFQFLQGKAIQQEFCHAFNSLVDQRRQVVIAADVPPSQLDTVDQRMRSRLMGGLVVDIEAPDQELRRKIVEVRRDLLAARDPQGAVPNAILDMIAERVTGGGRELEGALNRVIAFQQFNSQPITADMAAMVLREAAAQGPDQNRIKIDDILKVVGLHYNVSKNDLLSPRRARSVVVPRQVGMYLAKKLTSRSLPEIGRRFGGRDHSTVLHAVRKIDEQMRGDEKLARDLAQLIRLIEQG